MTPAQQLHPKRMGKRFANRLSFMRILLRNLISDGSQIKCIDWNIGADGFGHALYGLHLGGHDYTLFATTQHLPDEARTDRVIATAWDAAFVLYDGVPDAQEVARLKKQAPLQEAGRFGERDLVLSRANKSGRAFSHLIDFLKGQVPLDRALITEIGYAMRTTAVYGNGKFGIADHQNWADRPGLNGPFLAEMLTVYLIRTFTLDLVEFLGGRALPRDVKRYLGVGNATGLGMAPFLVSHPALLNAWAGTEASAVTWLQEKAQLDDQRRAELQHLASQISHHLDQWAPPDPVAQSDLARLKSDWASFLARFAVLDAAEIAQAALGHENPELTSLALSWLFEVLPELDDLANNLSKAAATFPLLEGSASTVLDQLRAAWPGLDQIDFEDPQELDQFWYVSEDKLEPRLGRRFEEPGADRESPLDIARRLAAMMRDLGSASGRFQDFLLDHPQHLFAARRAAGLIASPRCEVRANLLAKDVDPIDLLRFKLSHFGATKFDPKSRLWTRIALAQGAPLADELYPGADRGAWMPVLA